MWSCSKQLAYLVAILFAKESEKRSNAAGAKLEMIKK